MYMLYVDHSGEVSNPSENYFVMAGVAVFERQIYHLEQELQRIQQDYLPEVTGRIEFHAYPMRNRRAPWNGLPRERVQQLMTDIYDCISTAHPRGVCLFGEAIQKSRVVPNFKESMMEALVKKKEAIGRLDTERGNEKAKWREKEAEARALLKELTSQVIDAAFERLCTQFEFFLRRFYDPDDPEQQQRGIIVFDHASYEKDVELLMESFQKHGTGVTPVYNVVETPFFADSSSTRFLQTADFVSYTLYRRYERHDTLYFDKIAHRFDEHDGVYHGLVHYTSDKHCTCPACLTRRTGKQPH